jgi:hypothetical protein
VSHCPGEPSVSPDSSPPSVRPITHDQRSVSPAAEHMLGTGTPVALDFALGDRSKQILDRLKG